MSVSVTASEYTSGQIIASHWALQER